MERNITEKEQKVRIERLPPQGKSNLKELPNHLKYVYLEEGEQKPMIIFTGLNEVEEEELIKVLRKNKLAIE